MKIQVKNDTSKLQEIIGSNLYSSPYSFLQEVCQNAVDSMRRAGKSDEYVILGINEDPQNGQFYLYIRDFGTSFKDKEEYIKYCCTLLESSKDQNKSGEEGEEMGRYGIGKISPSAYNKEWFYSIYKNGKGFDSRVWEVQYDGIHHEESDYYDTTEKDGVYFKIYLTRSLEEMVSNIKKKLCYFENIYYSFDIMATKNLGQNNIISNTDLKIVKGDTYCYSTMNVVKELHFIIDQYTYEISSEDYREMNILKLDIPIALRFTMDEIDVNSTREQVKRNDKFYINFKAKYEKFLEFVIPLWEKSIEKYAKKTVNNFTEYSEALQLILNSGITLFSLPSIDKKLEISKSTLDVIFNSNYINRRLYFPQLVGVTKVSEIYNKISLDHIYNINGVVKNGVRTKRTSGVYIRWNNNVMDLKIYLQSNKFTKKEKEMVDKVLGGNYVIVSRDDIDTIKSRLNKDLGYYSRVLPNNVKENIRKLHSNLNEEEFEVYFKNVTLKDLEKSIEIFESNDIWTKDRIEKALPKDEIDKIENKVVDRYKKPEDTIRLKVARKSTRSDSGLVYDTEYLKLSEIPIKQDIYLYITCKTLERQKEVEKLIKDTESLLSSLSFRSVKKADKKVKKKAIFKIVVMNQKDSDMVKDNPKFVDLEFGKEKDVLNFLKYTKRALTGSLIRELIINNKHIFDNKEYIGVNISSSLGKDLEKLEQYMNTNKYLDNFSNTKDMYEELMSLMRKHDLWDYTIIDTYRRIANFIKKADFFDYLKMGSSVIENPKIINLIQNNCRYLKIKMDWQHYTPNGKFLTT